ncbi:MAG: peptidoglycan -binding protein [Pseudomonadota bacterium]|jgi:chemotaxis protein MotB
MSYASRRVKRRDFDVWPGYVDALSSMLMMIALVLMVMVAAQFYLGNALNTKDIALDELSVRLRALTDSLTLEQNTSKSLKAKNTELEANYQRGLADLNLLRTTVAEKEKLAATFQVERDIALAESTKAKGEADALNVQLAAIAKQVEDLNKKLALLTADLSSTKSTLLDKDKQITDLDQKLKKAMLKKVEELADYRSDFFGKLKKALSNRPEIRVVGDRFVFQSEVLFPSASAQLEEGGKQELQKMAETLKQVAQTIPKEVNWILTVIGHTDRRPIRTAQFPSNWDLSTARALSVVKFLQECGIPASRLAATGYGEHQPLEGGATEEAFAKNRRIELKFNQK